MACRAGTAPVQSLLIADDLDDFADARGKVGGTTGHDGDKWCGNDAIGRLLVCGTMRHEQAHDCSTPASVTSRRSAAR
jgi:hypothetical protein